MKYQNNKVSLISNGDIKQFEEDLNIEIKELSDNKSLITEIQYQNGTNEGELFFTALVFYKENNV